MQTCETCRHWVQNEAPDGFGQCKYVVMWVGKEPVGPCQAYTMSPDYSGYESALITRADFGCIAHEPRENQTT